MVLLRRVIGDALRARRQGQHRTLREVSTAANVSLGYLSEIERGQKEASSELLAAICDALGAQLSDLLRQVSDTLAMAEEMEGMLVPVGGGDDAPRVEPAAPAQRGERVETSAAPQAQPVDVLDRAPAVPRAAAVQRAAAVPGTAAAQRAAAIRLPRPAEPVQRVGGNGEVSVSVRHDSPLRTTLRTTRALRVADRERDVVYAA